MAQLREVHFCTAQASRTLLTPRARPVNPVWTGSNNKHLGPTYLRLRQSPVLENSHTPLSESLQRCPKGHGSELGPYSFHEPPPPEIECIPESMPNTVRDGLADQSIERRHKRSYSVDGVGTTTPTLRDPLSPALTGTSSSLIQLQDR